MKKDEKSNLSRMADATCGFDLSSPANLVGGGPRMNAICIGSSLNRLDQYIEEKVKETF